MVFPIEPSHAAETGEFDSASRFNPLTARSDRPTGHVDLEECHGEVVPLFVASRSQTIGYVHFIAYLLYCESGEADTCRAAGPKVPSPAQSQPGAASQHRRDDPVGDLPSRDRGDRPLIRSRGRTRGTHGPVTRLRTPGAGLGRLSRDAQPMPLAAGPLGQCRPIGSLHPARP